ncbi:MAG: SIS domain-containing protein [Candidatus Promineifilaceae bacterium]|nr:SIS domain-containing protein [Candidatus Promineifilaceae bacterium]
MAADDLRRSHLHGEIREQPAVLRRFLSQEQPTLEALAEAIHRRSITQVVIAARGTSDNAGRYAQYVLGAHNGLSVGLATPSLYTIYRRPPRLGDALVLGISQSGESPDIVAVLTEAGRQGALTAAITNAPDSELARAARYVIDIGAGPERAVAATKSYTAQLAAIAALSARLDPEGGRLEALARLPAAVEATLAMEIPIAAAAPRYRYMRHCVVIGRGYNYATAFELALKLKELTYAIVEPYSSADFQHGPVAVLEPGFPVIVIAPSGAMAAEMEEFMAVLAERQAEIVAISDVSECLAQARMPLTLPVSVPEWLSPLVTIVPGQLLAAHLAHARDLDLDQPRGLHKVTKTE